MFGRKWLYHLSRHCFPRLPGMCVATSFQEMLSRVSRPRMILRAAQSATRSVLGKLRGRRSTCHPPGEDSVFLFAPCLRAVLLHSAPAAAGCTEGSLPLPFPPAGSFSTPRRGRLRPTPLSVFCLPNFLLFHDFSENDLTSNSS